MEKPDPDPNLASVSDRPRQQDDSDPEISRPPAQRGKAPRTSEIFRSVMAPAGDPRPPAESSTPGVRDEAAGEAGMPDLGVLDRGVGSTASDVAGDRYHEGTIPWGQIVLLSYASILTLALTLAALDGTHTEDRGPRTAARRETDRGVGRRGGPATGPARPGHSASSSPDREHHDPGQAHPARRPGGQAALGRSQVRGPHPHDRFEGPTARGGLPGLAVRPEEPVERSNLPPLDRILVRERELRSFDPYIETSEGRSIRLFPLALDSEWSLLGQGFPVLKPGGSAQTFIAAEPGSANLLADEMTWRLRLRIGVYRSDMMGVKFTKAEVRRPIARSRRGEKSSHPGPALDRGDPGRATPVQTGRLARSASRRGRLAARLESATRAPS